jgi:hypothetical protein
LVSHDVLAEIDDQAIGLLDLDDALDLIGEVTDVSSPRLALVVRRV